ncbi:hypothetical protein HEP74_01257 [Xanthomonas sp. SS]|nr:hypothetical protein HEP74_01257 [Xanthomonas sp. SS]
MLGATSRHGGSDAMKVAVYSARRYDVKLPVQANAAWS